VQVTFLGVGEAFDETLDNTSLFVTAGRDKPLSLLLDCGFTAAAAYFRLARDPQGLDAVWVSHFHGDHFFGLPALFLRMQEEGRIRPLSIVSQPGGEEKVRACLDLAYPNLIRKGFALEFHELTPTTALSFRGVRLSCAASEHSAPSFALRVDDGNAAILYSGDGRLTPQGEDLARGCGLAVLEAYGLEEQPGHATVAGAIAAARRAGVPRLALAHLNRDVRRGRRAEISRLLAAAGDLDAFLPEPGDAITI